MTLTLTLTLTRTLNLDLALIPTKGLRLHEGVDLDALAARLEGYSGADVQLVCRDAALAPMRAAIAGKSPEEIVSLQSRGAPAAPTPSPHPYP